MEVDVNKESVCINKLICNKREIFFVEEDMIVPDSKPDILNSINLSGNVCIYKKDVMDGKVRIEGCINTYIMYLPESADNNLRGLNATLDFSQTIPIDECKEGMHANIFICIKDLECKVLNERKINVRAGLEANIKIYSNDNIELITGLNNIKDIQTLNKNLTVNSFVGENFARAYVKDTLNINEQDEISEILKVDINLVDNDIKMSYHKVLSKCEVEINIMYLTQDNRIGYTKGKIPAVGFIDMPDISENNTCDISNEINNIVIRPNSFEEHSIYVEIELETNCIAFEEKEINLIQDLYSPEVNLRFIQKKLTTPTNKITRSKNFAVTSKTNIPELIEGNLIDVQISNTINKEQITNSKLICEGDMTLTFIFTNSNNNVNSKVSKIPFTFSIENPIENENVSTETKITITDKKFDIKQNGDVDCNISLESISEFTQNESINIIDNIEISEDDEDSGDYDSLILYIVKQGDTLWNIAKKFRSTIDDIARVNGIENPDKITVGQKLYIPKFKSYIKKGKVDAISA